MINFCSGFGKHHTNNPDAKRPKDLVTTSYNKIIELAKNPPGIDKHNAQWVIATDTVKRDKATLLDAQYHMLVIDLDVNTPPCKRVVEAVQAVTDKAEFLYYNSKSATPDNPKCRILIPIAKPISGHEYERYQGMLNSKLSRMGIKPDPALEKCQQIIYLPNKGKLYEYYHHKGDEFNPVKVWKELSSRVVAPRLHNTLIGEFNAQFTIEQFLGDANYTEHNGHWRHPESESGSFSLSIKDDKAHSLSSNDPLYLAEGGHDAFGVFTILKHDGNIKSALCDAGDNYVLNQSGESWNSQRDSTKYLIEKYIFISEKNGCFYNTKSGTTHSAGALNTLHGDLKLSEIPSAVIAQSKDKKVADRLGWHPTDTEIFEWDGISYANTYRKPNLTPKAGDISEWLRLMKFIYGEYIDLVMQHFAFTLQRPAEKIRWQILTHGIPRTGKTMTAVPIANILGRSASTLDNDRFGEAWGDIYFQKKVLLFEEVMQPDMKQFNRLKPKLTNNGLEHYNLKGGSMVTQQNLYSMYMFSNHSDALRFNADENKLLVIQAPSTFINGSAEASADFYTSLGRKLDSDRAYLAAIYHHLLNLDISEFEYGRLPLTTTAALAMVDTSRPEPELRMLEWIEEGVFFEEAFKIYRLLETVRGYGYRNYSIKSLGLFLKSQGFIAYTGEKTLDGRKKRVKFWSKGGQGMTPTQLYDYYEANEGI